MGVNINIINIRCYHDFNKYNIILHYNGLYYN